MRKKTEISLVIKRPHLFHESILNGLALSADNLESTEGKKARFRWDCKREDFFECGEGWMPIIAAFAESLDHFICEYEIAEAEVESSTEETSIVIKDAMSHQHRLCILVAITSDIDELLLSKIRALQEFATAMSGFICEVCGTRVIRAELDSRVRCAVCRCREI